MWPKTRPRNFKFKSCLFDATNIVKNSNKEKSACISGCGIAFDGTGS